MTAHVQAAALWLLAILSLCGQAAPASAAHADDVQVPANILHDQEWSVNHVGVVMRDLGQTQNDYEQLDFKVGAGGRFPGGASNSVVSLQDNSYLELLTVSGSPSDGLTSELADFLKKHEGAMFLAFKVSSAKAAAEYLNARNFAVSDPTPGSIMTEGQTIPPPSMWYAVNPAEPKAGKKGIPMPVGWVEFVSVERREKRRAEGMMDHPNTAVGIHAVWFAVHYAEGQRRMFRDIRLEDGESREVKFLSAHGREMKPDRGVIMLLESSSKDGLPAKYLSDQVGPQGRCNCPEDEGIIGLSIEVADLGKARRLAQSGTGRKMKTYQGFYGRSFLLPPEVTHGVWMEMFQAPEHSH